MGALFRVIWQIAMLRQGPQVLPASSALFWLVLAAHWLTGVVLALYTLPPDAAMLSAFIGTLIMVALVHSLLVVHKLQIRFTQTVTALAACEVLLGLFSIPLTAMLLHGGDGQAIAAMFSLLMLGWQMAITAHIFRHALNTTMGIGFLFAIGYTLISISLGSAIGPPGN